MKHIPGEITYEAPPTVAGSAPLDYLSNTFLSPGPSWRRPTPHRAVGYRPGCPPASWQAVCTRHWTREWRSQRLSASDRSPGGSGCLPHSSGYRRTRRSPSTCGGEDVSVSGTGTRLYALRKRAPHPPRLSPHSCSFGGHGPFYCMYLE